MACYWNEILKLARKHCNERTMLPHRACVKVAFYQSWSVSLESTMNFKYMKDYISISVIQERKSFFGPQSCPTTAQLYASWYMKLIAKMTYLPATIESFFLLFFFFSSFSGINTSELSVFWWYRNQNALLCLITNDSPFCSAQAHHFYWRIHWFLQPASTLRFSVLAHSRQSGKLIILCWFCQMSVK